VLVDGKKKATVDLYAATPANLALTYAGLASRAHTVTIKVLGTKRAGSSGTKVTIDGFRVGSSTTVVQDSSPSIAYDGWTGGVRAAASGGSLRSTGLAGRTSSLSFTGTGISWITARGPAYGKASVRIDGGPAVPVDLYQPSTTWRAVGRAVTGLAPGPHTIVISAQGKKNVRSHGFAVPVDAFLVTG
jgi:hypothetical protein